ncbi:glycoside hydrolase family 2 protein [Fulvivirga sp. 29W222]|uniref:Glycoside hydrolase family 2 protein n=1 Tax=Fulvivirga marina TaxID=2494733 RepID=A0A937FZF6_9BACT|nr:beta-galactosidase GalB [Fulvivirga marina]MBL6447180.1 glycoside hydrolase family 2 protein [Fulvivirga marina]
MYKVLLVCLLALAAVSCQKINDTRVIQSFNDDWYFMLADSTMDASVPDYDHSSWRTLSVPHDWSIEGEFSKEHPATEGGGALPGGVGWYRKTFQLDEATKGKRVYLQFDGIYMNSEVWINGHYLGKRPFGYISFEYDLTPYLSYGKDSNVVAVKVNNSKQPNSRWYSGSGIYRNTRLVITSSIHVAQWGTYVKVPELSKQQALVKVQTTVLNTTGESTKANVHTFIKSKDNKVVTEASSALQLSESETVLDQELLVSSPQIWSINDPNLYTVHTEVSINGEKIDTYTTPLGIRTFSFDQQKGFTLNGEQVKIKGVCLHHDLGCLGSAINTRAIERQLEIMKEMGVNAIRTSHNPPAPELLDLCDKMGLLVMDETFDMWSMKKSEYDYSLYWDEWHVRDLTDHIIRDRNHPSVFVWSIGNEITDQWHPIGDSLARELTQIVRSLDDRPITSAMNPPNEGNTIALSGTLDLIGYNYAHDKYELHNDKYPNTPFIATETTSALETRGYYDQKSDTIKRWPIQWDKLFVEGNPGNTVSAYDQVSTPWGSTHEETWKIIKKHDFLSGMFIWTGFDYLGEPTPYAWPSRSSYFGIVDLAGFPKDAYYMYQSEWADKDVLHVLPHWNWTGRDSVDVWAYYNHADEVELFLNGKSLGAKSKEGEELHVMWRVAYEPGELKAVSIKNGELLLEKAVVTAGEPISIRLTPDRNEILADGKDLSFITVEVLDKDNNPVPVGANEIQFSIEGSGKIVGVGNGDPTSHLSLKGDKMKMFNGKCLVVIQSGQLSGKVVVHATSKGLKDAETVIKSYNIKQGINLNNN